MKLLKGITRTLLVLSVFISLNMTGCEEYDSEFCRTCYADYPNGDRISEPACSADDERQFKDKHGDAAVTCY